MSLSPTSRFSSGAASSTARGMARPKRIFRVAGDQEIQASRPRISRQVSRLYGLPRLRGRPAAPGSAQRKGRRQVAAGRVNMSISDAAIFSKTELSRRDGYRRKAAARDSPAYQVPGRGRPGVFDAQPSRVYPSGGEAQRIQLATNLGSLLVGTLYVLDEPNRPAPARQQRLIRILENLRDIGNTVLVVEHDEETMRAADHILDIGPPAGESAGTSFTKANFRAC